MATEATAAPKKRRSSGTRTQKPVFAVVSYTDENGNSVVLNKQGLSIRLERDAAKLLDMLEGGTGSSAIVRVELPAPTQRAAAAA